MNKNYFQLGNGQIIKDIGELPLVLEKIDTNLFSTHVTPFKNDFAKWIYDIFNIQDLSSMLSEVKSKEEHIRILKAYLKQSNIGRQSGEVRQVYSWKPSNAPQDNQTKSSTAKEEITEKKESKPNTKNNPTNADEYFDKNPVTFSQVIDAKKKIISIEPLQIISYNGKEIPEQLIEIFKDNYANAYQTLTIYRKNGFDTSIAEIMLFRIPPKIRIFEVTREEKDAVLVKRYLNEIIEELNNMNK